MLKKTNRRPGLMAFDLYEHIIDQCCGFPDRIKTLRLYKDGEPLLNPNFIDMIWCAEGADKFDFIDTTTNGLLLTKELNREIAESRLDRINISVPKDYDERYVDNVAHLFGLGNRRAFVFAKIAGDYLTEEERQKFLVDFKDIADDCAIEHTAPCWPTFDSGQVNTELGVYGQKLEGEVDVCPYIFYQMAVNADGTVSQCFLDWNYSNVMGNLKTDDIVDVWRGRKFRDIREVHLSKERFNMYFCKDCQQLKYGMPDNIDPYADEILRRI
jgi:radical SAM protein with 4Fe4S-binding SPASM domain